jgi:hypothetical protein
VGRVDRHITLPDLITMRRAIGMDPHLPSEQTLWLLDEAERLLRQRQELQAVVARLEEPWRDVRATMNQIAALLRTEG